MTRIRKLLHSLRTHPRLAGALGLALVLLAGALTLQQRAAAAAQARQLPEVRAFEADAQAWLRNERSLADFRRSLAEQDLTAVALAATPPGLVLYTLKTGEKASTTVPGCTPLGCAGTLLDGLGERSAQTGFALVSVQVDARPSSRRLLDAAETVVSPLLVIGAVLGALFVVTRLQMGLGGASMLTVQPATRFADVVGSDEAKAALARVRSFLGEPAKYARLGATPPRGVLLVGPPGTGKTLLARALAGECHASFIAVDGSYFTAMYYGAGVAKVKALFELARRHAPCVLFIDEIDGIGQRSQGRSGGGAESELNRIINRVLVEMDGFDPLNNVVVVGATNHEDNIDEALRRPGRFDMLVRLALPMLPDRQRLFDLYLGRRYFPMVLAYVDWYFRHLNGDPTAGLPLDYNGDTGTVYDYDVNVATGAETYAPDPATGHTPSYDSTDAYAGTFLTLIRRLAEADPAADSYIRSKSTQLSEIAGAAISTRQSNNLTGARPDYLAEYLMDNVEVYSGLQDYVWVLTNVLNDPTDATTWNKSFGKERDAITANLSLAATSQMYCWAADQCSSTNWSTFYSASVSQLWPINAGIATGSRAHSLWTTFKTDWSTCATTAVCDLGSPWAVIALTAANQGDTTAVDSYISGAQTNWINSGRPWPWSVADSADLASAAAIESP